MQVSLQFTVAQKKIEREAKNWAVRMPIAVLHFVWMRGHLEP